MTYSGLLWTALTSVPPDLQVLWMQKETLVTQLNNPGLQPGNKEKDASKYYFPFLQNTGKFLIENVSLLLTLGISTWSQHSDGLS